MEQNYIAHHGVTGQKWGVRRFQNKDGSLTRAGRKRYGVDDPKKAKEKKRETKEKETKEQYNSRKEKALRAGSAEEILKFQGNLSNKELQDAIARIGFEKQLKDISNADKKTMTDKIKDLGDKVETVDKATQKGVSLWNTVAKVVNSISDDDVMPILDGGETRRKKAEQAKKDAEEAEKKQKEADAAARKKLIETADLNELVKKFGTGDVTLEDLKNAADRVERQKKVEDYVGKNKNVQDAPSENSGTGVKGSKWVKKESSTSVVPSGNVKGGERFGRGKEKVETVTGEILDRDTPSASSSPRISNTLSYSGRTFYTDDFVDRTESTSVSTLRSGTISSGQSRVSGLLSSSGSTRVDELPPPSIAGYLDEPKK